MDTLLEDRPATADTDDPGRLAHVVYPKAALTEALIMGTPVTAVCGHTWVPCRDPRRYPVCSRCREKVEAAGLTVPTA